jgi:PiT family inorganic phosphate transporter
MSSLVVFLVGIALVFDFLNGLHDSANSIATVVSTRVLHPGTAVLWAAFFNFIAFLVFGLHVADTMGRGLVAPGVLDSVVVFGALIGAIAWNIVTWIFGIPSSSSHALVGGLVGAVMVKGGPGAILWGGLKTVALAILVSPLIGLVLAGLLSIGATWTSVRSSPFAVDRHFRYLQFVSSALLSLGDGGNDAQKTMGIIAGLLFAQGVLKGTFYVPLWVVLACQGALALGTLSGGWRIVKTVGSRITDLKPMQGFCAETAGAVALFGATWLGIPVSTTHTLVGSIVGAGAIRRVSAVRWGMAKTIVVAWVVTLPAAAVVGALSYELAALFNT